MLSIISTCILETGGRERQHLPSHHFNVSFCAVMLRLITWKWMFALPHRFVSSRFRYVETGVTVDAIHCRFDSETDRLCTARIILHVTNHDTVLLNPSVVLPTNACLRIPYSFPEATRPALQPNQTLFAHGQRKFAHWLVRRNTATDHTESELFKSYPDAFSCCSWDLYFLNLKRIFGQKQWAGSN